ncbi:MAG: hypothetical protein PF637_11750 [Spirochaetes bacterium]|jgi:hypothetical protein|nr:hypothetical protein [Spirochaetota bacterium]
MKPINLPDPADKYLTENYGDWRKPDPYFDAFLYAPNTEIIWQEYRDLQAVRTIYNSLCYKNRARAKKVAMDNLNLLTMTTEGKMLAQILVKQK